MNHRADLLIFASCLLFTFVTRFASAQESTQLPEWAANAAVVEKLGEAFADERVSIRPPRHLQKVDRGPLPEMEKIGLLTYGWTPEGTFPALENLSITLTPFAMPSSDALDKSVEGMQGSIQKSFADAKFEPARKGKFLGQEARAGRYTATVAGQEIMAFYLVGIDKTGTFAISAMIPTSLATPEKISEVKAAMLTFQRVK